MARHMFLCFCQLALAPLLGPYPQAYKASQLRSLRRAPGRLDHRPVHIMTDPELKHLAGIGGARSGRSRVGATKKRADLGSSCHVGHGSATLVVAPIEIKKVTKTRPGATDSKASPDAPPDFFLMFLWSSRPEHNQRLPTDTAKRRFALILTRRKIAVSPLGAQSTPPLARCRSVVAKRHLCWNGTPMSFLVNN